MSTKKRVVYAAKTSAKIITTQLRARVRRELVNPAHSPGDYSTITVLRIDVTDIEKAPESRVPKGEEGTYNFQIQGWYGGSLGWHCGVYVSPKGRIYVGDQWASSAKNAALLADTVSYVRNL
jgi:hypothetical protein